MTEEEPGGGLEMGSGKFVNVNEDIEVPKDVVLSATNNDGPYLQMILYAIAGFFFTTVVVTQLPLISEYFGGPSVLFYILFAYGGTSNVVRVYLLWHYSRFPASTAERLSTLVHVGAVATAAALFLYPISMCILGKNNEGMGFWVCLILAGLAGISNSLLMNAGFTFMSIAPQKSAMFYLVGQGCAQVVSWPTLILLHLVVKQLGGGTQTNFIVAVITLVVAGIMTLGLIPLYRLRTRTHPVFSNILMDFSVRSTSMDSSPRRGVSQKDLMIRVFKKVFVPAICTWLVCFFTFMVYPSQISRWTPTEGAPYGPDHFQSFMIYIFAVADTAGRYLSRGLLKWAAPDWRFVLTTIIRGVVLCPMVVLSSYHLPEWLSADASRLVLMIVFGFSQGINFTLATMMAPSLVEKKDKMTVGTILSFVVINGCFLGSLVGIGLKHLQ